MVEDQHTPGPPEGKIGLVLERARKDRGLSLEEAERATKIRKRYLIGLENDDYTVLPDAVYARGFLKTYANFLGLDGDGLSQELRTRKKPRRERRLSYAAPSSDFDRPIISPGGVPGAEKRQVVSKSAVVTFVIAALVIVALVGALYFVGLNVRPSAAEDAPQAERMAAPMERVDGEGPGGSDPGGNSGDEPSGALTVGVEVERPGSGSAPIRRRSSRRWPRQASRARSRPAAWSASGPGTRAPSTWRSTARTSGL
jgi:cytoskeleton protein RodZ